MRSVRGGWKKQRSQIRLFGDENLISAWCKQRAETMACRFLTAHDASRLIYASFTSQNRYLSFLSVTAVTDSVIPGILHVGLDIKTMRPPEETALSWAPTPLYRCHLSQIPI